MVSLRDIDADVILIDFWGSWCKECKPSSAHLRELQAKWGGGAGGGGAENDSRSSVSPAKRASIEGRRATAARGAQELGIPYPVLVSSKDGTCPVQKAHPGPVLSDNGAGGPNGARAQSRARGDRRDARQARSRNRHRAWKPPRCNPTTPRWHGNRLCPIVLTRRSPEGSWRTPRLNPSAITTVR